MIAFALAVLATPAPAVPVPVPVQPALAEQVGKADAALFELFFTGKCDAPRMRSMLADDIEFYHDKAGVTARSADEFMTGYIKNCTSRDDPKAWRSRRELVRTSLHIDPVPGLGAIEAGDHLFYERHGVDGEEKLVGKARFTMLWVLGADGNWRVSRIFSYAHAPAN